MTDRYARFMPVAQAFANMSKDESTQVGALILGAGREVLSAGWNGAPRGSAADEDYRKERPEKYLWFSHAEMNAIAQAARAGTSVMGGVLVVTHAPCMICARLIVQAGISKVVTRRPEPEFLARWGDDLQRTRILFDECGVDLQILD